MLVATLVSALHILGVALSFGSLVARTRAFSGTLDAAGIARVTAADNLWGVSAIVMIGTGLYRAFGGLEKGADFYLGSPMFHLKMGLLIAVLLLELWPMVTLVGWRVTQARGGVPDTSRAGLFGRLGVLQALLLVALVFSASGMARGLGL